MDHFFHARMTSVSRSQSEASSAADAAADWWSGEKKIKGKIGLNSRRAAFRPFAQKEQTGGASSSTKSIWIEVKGQDLL